MVQGIGLMGLIFLLISCTGIMVSRYKVHVLVVLLFFLYITASLFGMDAGQATEVIGREFGRLVGRIGIIIAAGMVISVALVCSGASDTIMHLIVKKLGDKHPIGNMMMLGFVLAIPIVCDAAYMLLFRAVKNMADRSRTPLTAMAAACAAGIYVAHSMILPTPGPLIAASVLHIKPFVAFVLGAVVAACAVCVGWLWIRYCVSRMVIPNIPPELTVQNQFAQRGGPGMIISLAPLVVPGVLMSLKAIASISMRADLNGGWIYTLGEPMVAMCIGVLCCIPLAGEKPMPVLSMWIEKGLRDAAPILFVAASGGVLGSLLISTTSANNFLNSVSHYSAGIYLAFILAAAIKILQGSSTTAMITASSVLAPLMGSGAGIMNVSIEPTLMMLAAGAGSLVCSHINDPYFWLVSETAGMNFSASWRMITITTLFMGLTAMAIIVVLQQLMC